MDFEQYFHKERMMWPEPPWNKTGEIPIKWFENNFDVFIHDPTKIIAESVPYELNDGPNKSGIYFLIRNNSIVYVGLSNSICRRLIQHHDSDKQFDSYWCFGNIPEIFIGYVEAFYIHLLEPELNDKYDYLEKVAVKYLEMAKNGELF